MSRKKRSRLSDKGQARDPKKSPMIHPLESDGLWCEVLPGALRGRPALFLDRDGVVIDDPGYLYRVEDMIFIPGATATIAAANRAGIAVVLVSNQSGVGHGYYGWQDFATVQGAILDHFAGEGARIDAVYACAYHPEARGSYAHPDHPARKPNPGMLLKAASDLAIDLKSSWMVGDRASDIEAAKRAGLPGALHVLTGAGTIDRPLVAALAADAFDVRLGRSIADATALPVLRPSPKD
jgi:D-glycero-D-manno-heptose 1,7-bisphosphate phosphatase